MVGIMNSPDFTPHCPECLSDDIYLSQIEDWFVCRRLMHKGKISRLLYLRRLSPQEPSRYTRKEINRLVNSLMLREAKWVTGDYIRGDV